MVFAIHKTALSVPHASAKQLLNDSMSNMAQWIQMANTHAIAVKVRRRPALNSMAKATRASD